MTGGAATPDGAARPGTAPAARAPLGRTGLAVSRVGLGSGPLGGMFAATAEDEALATVRAALDAGLTLLDTAPWYGLGLAEERLGRALRGAARERLVLCTKVGRLLVAGDGERERAMWPGAPGRRAVFDFSYDGALRSLEQSLERLGVDRVDVVHIHDPLAAPPEEVMAGAYRALARLRDEGTIAAIGVGMGNADLLARYARAGDFDCLLLASRYTLLDQTALGELLPLCERRGIAVILGGAFNSGILADPRPGAMCDYAPATDAQLARARELQAACAAFGVSLKAAALRFPLGHPAVASVLLGARSRAELHEGLVLAAQPIPSAMWDELTTRGLLPADAPRPPEEVLTTFT